MKQSTSLPGQEPSSGPEGMGIVRPWFYWLLSLVDPLSDWRKGWDSNPRKDCSLA